MLNKAYPPHVGGIERVVESLAEGLARRGVMVDVLVCSEDFSFSRQVKENLSITRVRRCGRVSSLPLGISTLWRARRMAPDVIHVHVPYPLGEVATLLAPRRIPVVATWHSDIVRQVRLGRLYRPLQEMFLSRARFLLPTSPPMLEHSPQLSRYREKCRVVHLGVEAARFALTPALEHRVAELKREWGRPTILFVGRLIEYKGLPILINAMQGVPARLEIVGDGRLRASLAAQVRHMQLEEQVHFAGEVSEPELIARLHACEFLVLPSTGVNETLGLAQLEAMACGKPVVCTTLPTGVPYVTQDEVTGLHVPPGNAPALRAALLRLLTDEPLRRRLGQAARERVEARFSADAMVEETLALYREAVRKG